MAKRKLKKFAELKTFPNVFEIADTQLTKPFKYRGKWCKSYFNNQQTIILELACGKGDYTLALAAKYPDKNYIGIDIKGDRLWRGAKTALENKLENVVFIRTQIEETMNIFDKEEIDEIWITFPDPFPKKSRAGKRLTSPRFLNLYKQYIVKGGIIHLKTDEENLYQFTLETLIKERCTIHTHTDNVYDNQIIDSRLNIKTFYELQHLKEGRTIKYVRFSL